MGGWHCQMNGLTSESPDANSKYGPYYLMFIMKYSRKGTDNMSSRFYRQVQLTCEAQIGSEDVA
jgi:hypothetical protein